MSERVGTFTGPPIRTQRDYDVPLVAAFVVVALPEAAAEAPVPLADPPLADVETEPLIFRFCFAPIV